MAMGAGEIKLTTTERSDPTNRSFNTRASAVERWVEELPSGNVGAMSKEVYNVLREVNRLNIGWRDRRRFLELLRPPVTYLQEQLQRRYIGIPLPTPPKVTAIINLSQTFANEMALGYKIAIEEMLHGSLIKRDSGALTELIHRAVHYLNSTLLTNYRSYAPHQENSWFELHQLYLYAEHKDIHTTLVEDRENHLLPTSSIARQYKQILLLALASPYRMHQKEVYAVYKALSTWAGQAQIIPYDDPSAGEALFVVHMDSDDEPDFHAFNHRDCNNEFCRLIDTSRLSEQLHELLGDKGERMKKMGITSELLYRLLRAWGSIPKRRFGRSDHHETIEVVVGLSTVHRAIAEKRGHSNQLSDKSQYESKVVVSFSQLSEHDIWNIYGQTVEEYQQYQNYIQSLRAEEEKEELPPIHYHHWQVCNESAGGFRLSLPMSDSAQLQVGELLGLRQCHDDAVCQLGVVRWMIQTPDEKLELGVQVISPEAIPVMLRSARLSDEVPQLQPSLMLPEVPSIKQQATLLTPTRLFKKGMELLIYHPDQEIRVVLGSRVQRSGSFNQHHFSVKAEPEVPKAVKPEAAKQVDDDEFKLEIDWNEL